jgi:membrane-bound serine protease (ClpP class)
VNHRLDRRRNVAAGLLGLAGLLLAVAPIQAADASRSIVLVSATGEVDSVMADTIVNGLADASRADAAAVVIELNTPGGNLDDTQTIVSAMLGANVPVIVWVAPAGGYAASAGTFITMAANLAWMAPGTRIGAASPIDGSGNDIPGTLGVKVKNDAIAWMTSIAQTRHRPVDWAASTVDVARSSSAAEAVSLGAVDGIAATIDDVVAAANGRTVQTASGSVVLALAGAPIVEASTNPLAGILRLLADPNIAFLLFTVGVLSLLFELHNPNLLTGIFGVVAIALAAVGFVNLPTDLTGLLLVTIGLVLFALEPAIPSHGLLTIGGAIAFVVGGFALYSQSNQFGPAVQVAVPLLLVAAVSGAAFGLLITATAVRTRRMRGPTDTQPPSLVAGTLGEVRKPLEPLGSIYAVGEEWSARTADDRPLPRGTPVHVLRTDGLTVVVEPDPSG